MLEEADRQRRAFSEFRLPPGRHGIPPEEVAANQRWRLLGAAAEVLAESGHVRTTSTRVSKHAGVSPATFYQHFENVGECLLASYEAAVDCVWEIVSEACREGGDRLAAPARRRRRLDPPLPRGRAGDRPPARGRGAGRGAARSRTRAGRRSSASPACSPAVAACGARTRAELPAATERLLVAGAVATCSERVAAGDVERLPELGPQLTEMLSAPYVG